MQFSNSILRIIRRLSRRELFPNPHSPSIRFVIFIGGEPASSILRIKLRKALIEIPSRTNLPFEVQTSVSYGRRILQESRFRHPSFQKLQAVTRGERIMLEVVLSSNVNSTSSLSNFQNFIREASFSFEKIGVGSFFHTSRDSILSSRIFLIESNFLWLDSSAFTSSKSCIKFFRPIELEKFCSRDCSHVKSTLANTPVNLAASILNSAVSSISSNNIPNLITLPHLQIISLISMLSSVKLRLDGTGAVLVDCKSSLRRFESASSLWGHSSAVEQMLCKHLVVGSIPIVSS
jgi:hypothetical protein